MTGPPATILDDAFDRAASASLGRPPCLFCSKPCLQRYGKTSTKCWWCGTIFPREWLIGMLMARSAQKLTGQKKSP
jgi:hypothetical protein